jgi:hypothetical protein
MPERHGKPWATSWTAETPNDSAAEIAARAQEGFPT